jgi:peptidoglycan/xylan/chitin deacetylase (PgdA/CDA1 family)
LSNIDRVDEETQGKLLELQDYGHELAAHTMNHIHPNTKTEVQYMQEEIYNHIELSEKLGFDIQAFSYPLGEGTPRLDGLLLQEYNSLRYIGSIGQDRTFYKNRCTRILNAGSLDHRRGITKQDLYEVIERVYRDNSIVILYGHTILEEEPYSDYSISYELLEYLIETAQEKGISFFTVSEVFE